MKNTIPKKIPVLFLRPKKIPFGQKVRPKKIVRTPPPPSLKYVSGAPGVVTKTGPQITTNVGLKFVSHCTAWPIVPRKLNDCMEFLLTGRRCWVLFNQLGFLTPPAVSFSLPWSCTEVK